MNHVELERPANPRIILPAAAGNLSQAQIDDTLERLWNASYGKPSRLLSVARLRWNLSRMLWQQQPLSKEAMDWLARQLIRSRIRLEGTTFRFRYNLVHRDAAGNIKAIYQDTPNIAHDEGEQYMLSAAFDTDLSGFGAAVANLYMGLRTNSAVQGDTLASGLTEVSGTGYARIAISTVTGWTISNVGGSYRATTGSLVFTATGTWTTATSLFITTASSGTSGKLLTSAALSTGRLLVSGDTLTCSAYVGLSN